jgi:hypothetical protein
MAAAEQHPIRQREIEVSRDEDAVEIAPVVGHGRNCLDGRHVLLDERRNRSYSSAARRSGNSLNA